MFLAFAMVAVTTAPAATNLMPMQVEEKVCRSVEQTGTVMRKRICMTKAEWKALEERNREKARDAMESGYNSPNG